jgi:predicted amidophosphoribosyltransferase
MLLPFIISTAWQPNITPTYWSACANIVPRPCTEDKISQNRRKYNENAKIAIKIQRGGGGKMTGASYREQNPSFSTDRYSLKIAENEQNPLKKFFP